MITQEITVHVYCSRCATRFTFEGSSMEEATAVLDTFKNNHKHSPNTDDPPTFKTL